MNRLTTNYLGCHQLILVNGNELCSETCNKQDPKMGCKGCPIAEAINKLAAYEDTGYEPDEIPPKIHLVEAEKYPRKQQKERQAKNQEIITTGDRVWSNRYNTDRGEYKLTLIKYRGCLYLWKMLDDNTVEFFCVFDPRRENSNG